MTKAIKKTANIAAIKDVNYELAHLNISGVTVGNKNAPVVLCLHGWLDNCASFLPFFEQMIATKSPLLDKFQFVAIDFPGHGLSSHRSADSQYHFIDWSYDVLQLLNVNQWKSVHIIGHSMGGMVATTFTSAFNDRVESLILVESIGLITDVDGPSEQIRKGLLSRLAMSAKRVPIHKDIDSAIKARMNVSDLNTQSAKLLVMRNLKQVEGGVTWRSDPRLKNVSAQRFSLKQAEQVVANIHCPVTVVLGDTGYDMVQSGVKVFSSHINNLQTLSITGGHHPHMESQQQFCQLVEQKYNK